jgi:hypothetical protein
MAAEIPDRVAAIVDLVSHLFMLSVMLFVLAIPFRPPAAATATDSLALEVSGYDDGKPVKLGLADFAKPQDALLEVAIYLSDGSTLRPLDDFLQHARHELQGTSIKIDGRLRERFSKSVVLLVTNTASSLVFAPLSIDIRARLSTGERYCAVSQMVIGRDSFLLIDPSSGSC